MRAVAAFSIVLVSAVSCSALPARQSELDRIVQDVCAGTGVREARAILRQDSEVELRERLEQEFIERSIRFHPPDTVAIRRLVDVLQAGRSPDSLGILVTGVCLARKAEARAWHGVGEDSERLRARALQRLEQCLDNFVGEEALDEWVVPVRRPEALESDPELVHDLFDDLAAAAHPSSLTPTWLGVAYLDWWGLDGIAAWPDTGPNMRTRHECVLAGLRRRPGLIPEIEQRMRTDSPRAVRRWAEYLAKLEAVDALSRGFRGNEWPARRACGEALLHLLGPNVDVNLRERCADQLAAEGLEHLGRTLLESDESLSAMAARILWELSFQSGVVRRSEGHSVRVLQGVRGAFSFSDVRGALLQASSEGGERTAFWASQTLWNLDRDSLHPLRVLARQEEFRWVLPVDLLRDEAVEVLVDLLRGGPPPEGWPVGHSPRWCAALALVAWHLDSLDSPGRGSLRSEIDRLRLDRLAGRLGPLPKLEEHLHGETWAGGQPLHATGNELRGIFGRTRGWFGRAHPELLRGLEYDYGPVRNRADARLVDAAVPTEVLLDSIVTRWRRCLDLPESARDMPMKVEQRLSPELVLPLLDDVSTGVRLRACAKLRRLAPGLTDVRVRLLEMAESDPEPAVREAAVETLERLGVVR